MIIVYTPNGQGGGGIKATCPRCENDKQATLIDVPDMKGD